MGVKAGKDYKERMHAEKQDLIDFVLHKKNLVHPNVIKMVLNRDNEGLLLSELVGK